MAGSLETLSLLLTTEKGDSPLLPKMKNRFTPNTRELHRELSTLLSIPKNTHLCLGKPMPCEDRGVKNSHCLPYRSHTHRHAHRSSFQPLSRLLPGPQHPQSFVPPLLAKQKPLNPELTVEGPTIEKQVTDRGNCPLHANSA